MSLSTGTVVFEDATLKAMELVAETMTLNNFSVSTTTSLQQATNTGNVTTNTVEFTNPTTSLVASGNVGVGGELTVSGNVEVGTANLFVDTVSGNVGIGTTTPLNILHVSSDIATLDASGSATFDEYSLIIHNTRTSGSNGTELGLCFNHYDTNYPDATRTPGAAITHERTDLWSKGKLHFKTKSVNTETGTCDTRMTIDEDGNVGIGTESPGYTLDIQGSSADLLRLQKTTNADGVGIFFSDNTVTGQYGNLRYYYQDSQSFGTGNCFRFSTTESSDAVVIGGALLIGVDGKDAGGNGLGHRKNLFIQSTYGGNTSQNYGWWIGTQDATLSPTDNDIYFSVVRNGVIKQCGSILDQNDATMNFTGQHRTFVKDVPIQQLEDKEGLIVSADQNEFIRMSGGIARGNEAITTNESLPIVSFSTKSNDKKCFGVVSTTEDPENRVEVYGNFASNMHKELGDTRVYINSVGEGAIWVTNINGPLESGDYITTSNVTGYGQRQDDDILHNYTVAKITMDCDFNPVTQTVHQIKKELAHVDYWIDYATSEIKQEEYDTLPENEREVREDKYYKIYKREVQKTNPGNDKFVHEVHQEMVNVLDEHGQLQWEDTDETEKAYKIRYLDASGQQTDEANAVHIAAFVGCTYHCG
jgi:hypothetical protein